jgi:hypothetical protein
MLLFIILKLLLNKMAQVFDEKWLFNGEEENNATKVNVSLVVKLEWWHWVLVAIACTFVILVIAISLYCFLMKRHMRRQINNNGNMYEMIQTRRYLDMNRMDQTPIFKKSKSSASKFSKISSDETFYRDISFDSRINTVEAKK